LSSAEESEKTKDGNGDQKKTCEGYQAPLTQACEVYAQFGICGHVGDECPRNQAGYRGQKDKELN